MIAFVHNFFRCICPSGTYGSHCKILRRHFKGSTLRHVIEDEGGGKSFLRILPKIKKGSLSKPLPPCNRMHITIEFKTTLSDAVIMYSSIDSLFRHKINSEELLNQIYGTNENSDSAYNSHESDFRTSSYENKWYKNIFDTNDFYNVDNENFNTENFLYRDMLMLSLVKSHPYLIINLGSGYVSLSFNLSNVTVADDTWHRIDIIWKDQVSVSFVILYKLFH